MPNTISFVVNDHLPIGEIHRLSERVFEISRDIHEAILRRPGLATWINLSAWPLPPSRPVPLPESQLTCVS